MVNGLDTFVMLPNLRVITGHHVPRGPSNNEVGTHRPKLLFPRLSLFFAKTQIFGLMAVIIQKRKSLRHSSLGTKMRLQCLQRATVAISQPFSTSSRIVTCFHEVEVDDEKQTFSDREPMHQRIYNLISEVWPLCASNPLIRLSDVIVHIQQDDHGETTFRISHKNAFREYFASLLPVSSIKDALIPQARTIEQHYISLESLLFFR